MITDTGATVLVTLNALSLLGYHFTDISDSIQVRAV